MIQFALWLAACHNVNDIESYLHRHCERLKPNQKSIVLKNSMQTVSNVKTFFECSKIYSLDFNYIYISAGRK